VLDISRVSGGRVNLNVEDVDFMKVVADAIARASEESERLGVEVRRFGPAQVMGRWDPVRLEQVIANLLSNALKYGEGKPVDVEVSTDQGQVQLRVRDQGVGVSPEDQRRIFQRFERASNTSKGDSFGLGLWIVRRLVEAMGGQVGVQSEPNRGSTFEVQLPLTLG
jgi:signal transduction histidine kinase